MIVQSQAWQEAEQRAPVNTDAPLPFSVNTLQFLPAERRQHYWRQMDGSFQLSWLAEDDPALGTFTEQIAAGKIRVVPAGRTWADMLESEAERKRSMEIFAAEMKAGEARQAAKRQEQIEAKLARQAEEAQRELERVRKSFAGGQ